MCGIFGAVKLEGYFQCDNYHQFVALTDTVSYRGPDASGYKPLDSQNSLSSDYNRFNIFLGHTRLSIIDLSEMGNQPFCDGNGLWIIYNGEIFNYLELSIELKEKGHLFKTKTDTEVILKVYREYGENGFSRLNGMWAFAIVDIEKQKVILSRDRFSIKPLYYYHNNDQFYFTSEIKQLLPLLKKNEINLEIFSTFLEQGLLDFNTETFFRRIYKVKPKCNLVINLINRKVLETQYWEYSSECVPQEENLIMDSFRELFLDSVRLRLRSDVPVGCLLSGGLDSSSIAITANEIQNGGISCFSVVSNDSKYSEESFVDIVREEKGINITKLLFNKTAAWENISNVLLHLDEPFGGFSVMAQNQIFELIRENSDIKVILSGQGGDEILCGYRKYFFFYLNWAIKNRQFGCFLQLIFSSIMHRTVLWQFSLSDARRYLPNSIYKRMDIFSGLLNFKNDLEPVSNFSTLGERQKLDIDKYSVPALTHYEDRNSMAYSLEVRNPFLDHRLVNFAISMPASVKIKYGWTKYALRKAVWELPSRIAWRRDKQGFITPEEKWIKYDFRDNILEIFRSSELHRMGLINKKDLLAIYQAFVNGDMLISRHDIARLILAELWVRKFF